MSNYLDNTKHWRERAAMTRTKANEFWNETERKRMYRIADEYDRLADQAAERQRLQALAVPLGMLQSITVKP